MTSLIVPPKKLAIYYGWPIAVNGTWSVAAAIQEFNAYDTVVFGSGLEESTHPEYQSTKDIINGSTANIYGYVDATLSLSVIQDKVDKWSIMGGTTKKIVGIFCDQFGYDYGLTRTQQNSIVDYIHGKSLNVFANAWNPDDVFKKSGTISTHMTTTDIYLAESYQIINGAYQDATTWKAKADKMKTYREIGPGKSQMACITTNDASAYDQNKFDYAYYSCALYAFDHCGWGEEYYSASSAQLPFRSRKQILGNKVTGNIVTIGTTYERSTNVGIHVDTTNHTVSEYLN